MAQQAACVLANMFVFTTLSAENATRLELPPPVNISPANVAHYEEELIKSRHTKRMFVTLHKYFPARCGQKTSPIMA